MSALARAARLLPSLLALAAACSTAPPERTELMRQTPRVRASAAELRQKMRAFAFRYAQIVDGAAERIGRDQEDRDVRLASLGWRIRGIPLAQTACFLGDPLAAMADTWALTVQQRMYFEDGQAIERFGDRAPIAIEASRRIEAEMEDVVRSVTVDGELAEGRDFVVGWAEVHRLPPDWSGRPSMVPDLAEFTEREELGALAQVGRLGEDVSDIAMRLSLYNEVLPNQARWQAEALLLSTGVEELVAELRAALPGLVEAEQQATEFLGSVERLVEDEVGRISEEIGLEREAILEYAETARLETIEELRAERRAVLEAVHGEIELLLERLVEERHAAVEDLSRLVAAEWPKIRDDLPAVGARSVAESGGELGALLDRLLLRLALLGGVGLLLAFLAALVLLRVAQRGRAAAPAHQV